jgi:hypothetical protein
VDLSEQSQPQSQHQQQQLFVKSSNSSNGIASDYDETDACTHNLLAGKASANATSTTSAAKSNASSNTKEQKLNNLNPSEVNNLISCDYDLSKLKYLVGLNLFNR